MFRGTSLMKKTGKKIKFNSESAKQKCQGACKGAKGKVLEPKLYGTYWTGEETLVTGAAAPQPARYLVALSVVLTITLLILALVFQVKNYQKH